MNFKNLRTREKLTLGFGVLLALTFLIAIIGVVNMKKINNRTDSIVAIESSQKEFILSRVYMSTYIRLKNDSLADEALKHINESLLLIEDVAKEIDQEKDRALIDEYIKELNVYKDLIAQNKQAVNSQNESIAIRRKLRDQIYEEGNKAGIQETHPVFSYFSLVRLNTANIMLFNDSSYYSKVQVDLKNMTALLNSGKAGAMKDAVVQYSKAIDNFYKAYLNSDELIQKQTASGRKITALSDNLVKQSVGFIDTTTDNAITFLILITLLSLALGFITAYIITRYFTIMLKKAATLAETYAKGDLTYKFSSANLELKDEIGDLARSMKNMGDKIKEVICGINNGAANLSDASEHISSATQEISKGANEQAAAVEEISSSMEEMSAAILQNSENAQKTGVLAQNSANDMDTMAATGQKSLHSVKEIISKINIINEIAFQTNILALNAAVEAARAGEQGRGFAVVAAEVRKLAERSRNAANEIIGLSRESLQVTEEAEQLMSDLVPKISSTASFVKEIVSSSEEQNSGASQVNNAIQQLNHITQENASSSEELATSAEELANQAFLLKEMIAYFKVDEEKLISGSLASAKKFEYISQLPDKVTRKQEKSSLAESKGFKLKLKSNVTDEQFEHF
ncbi:MAG: methyl-accepting chemotaxis protein [Bacteroidota bacterium]|nr:methyl-accepting chemotaxis protein [Bacteroidota bacterium]